IHRITMVRRPMIRELAAAVRLPDYMGVPDAQPVDASLNQISAPVGSTIELVAHVAGEAERGQIKLFKSTTATVEETREEEFVWSDDHLPSDARETGSWKWTAEQVRSGGRAHTFGWAREPYGFTTRLDPMTVAPDASVFVYAWIDPADTPRRLTVSF